MQTTTFCFIIPKRFKTFQNPNSQSGNPFGSVGLHFFTLMECAQISKHFLDLHSLSCFNFGCEPKARVMIHLVNEQKGLCGGRNAQENETTYYTW
jgi:hypothetical protein